MHDETSMPNASFEPAEWLIMKQKRQKNHGAIRRVLSGQISVSENMSAKILEIFPAAARKPRLHRLENLTGSRVRGFSAHRRGFDHEGNAGQMRISAKTVEVHRMNVKRS